MKISPLLFEDLEFKTPEMCTTGGVFDCVAVAINQHGIAVRSTNDPGQTTVTFSHEEWRNFVGSVKAGAFNV